MKSFLRILAYGKPFGRYWPAYLVLSVFSVLFGIANYALIAPLLTVLFEPDTLTGEMVRPEYSFSLSYIVDMFRYYLLRIKTQDGIMMALVYVSVALLSASLLSNIMHYFSQRVLVSVRTRLMKNVRDDLFRKISRLHIGY